MKRGTPDHPKVKKLCRLLERRLPEVVGTLELLWHFTAKFTPEGDIGRYSDLEIAEACGWRGRPEKLINALVAAGLVEVHPGLRLTVHDWHDHADDAVRKRLKRTGKQFACNQQVSESVSGQEADNVRTMSGQRPDKNRLPDPEPDPEPEPDPVPASSSPESTLGPASGTTTTKKTTFIEHENRNTPPNVPGFSTPAARRPTNGTSPPTARRPKPPDIQTPEQARALYEARNELIRFTRACPGPAAAWDAPDWDLVSGVLEKAGGIDGLCLMLKQLEDRKSQPGHSWGWFLKCAGEHSKTTGAGMAMSEE